MPRAVWWSWGGGLFLISEVPLYGAKCRGGTGCEDSSLVPSSHPRDNPGATQGQINDFLSQLPFKCYLPEVAFVGDRHTICPWVAARVVSKSFHFPSSNICQMEE